MTLCDWREANHLAKPHYQGRAVECVKCGAVHPRPSVRQCPVIGWGDRAEKLIGWLLPVTKKKKCGGCLRRKKLLNQIGAKR